LFTHGITKKVIFIFLLLFSEGKPIPTELRKDEAALRKAIEFDDEKHERMLSRSSLLFLSVKAI